MDAADGEIFNLGGTEAVPLLELAKLLLEITGRGSYSLVPFPPERKRIDIGDFAADASKIKRVLGWQPQVGLRDGLTRTTAYYREHWKHYL
jgi:UDP-glucose 4-epimerase